MSTALYRRYRPETFAEVIGQEHVTEPLMVALEKNRVNHAYLFSGPRGCGKTTSARILARCLNCAQGPTPTPCGVCDSCRELSRDGGGSLDVIEMDAASHGGVDHARDLRERATLAPVRDRYKIFIIDEAHMVTREGFNALLKIVEEPPEHVKFIFATTEPNKVLGTIRSRTHHYPFRLVPPEVLLPFLQGLCDQEQVPVEPGVLQLVIRAGGGSVRDSLSILDQLMAGASSQNGIEYDRAVALLGYTHAQLLDEVIEALGAKDAPTLFGAVSRVVATGQDPRRFVEDLLERLRDLIVVKAVPQAAGQILQGVPQDQLERLAQQAQALGERELTVAAGTANETLNGMTGAANPQLQLELLCARLLLPAVEGSAGGAEVAALASRLQVLERRVASGAAGSGPAQGGMSAARAAGMAAAGLTPKTQAPQIQAPNAQTPSAPVQEATAPQSVPQQSGSQQGSSQHASAGAPPLAGAPLSVAPLAPTAQAPATQAPAASAGAPLAGNTPAAPHAPAAANVPASPAAAAAGTPSTPLKLDPNDPLAAVQGNWRAILNRMSVPGAAEQLMKVRPARVDGATLYVSADIATLRAVKGFVPELTARVSEFLRRQVTIHAQVAKPGEQVKPAVQPVAQPVAPSAPVAQPAVPAAVAPQAPQQPVQQTPPQPAQPAPLADGPRGGEDAWRRHGQPLTGANTPESTSVDAPLGAWEVAPIPQSAPEEAPQQDAPAVPAAPQAPAGPLAPEPPAAQQVPAAPQVPAAQQVPVAPAGGFGERDSFAASGSGVPQQESAPDSQHVQEPQHAPEPQYAQEPPFAQEPPHAEEPPYEEEPPFEEEPAYAEPVEAPAAPAMPAAPVAPAGPLTAPVEPAGPLATPVAPAGPLAEAPQTAPADNAPASDEKPAAQTSNASATPTPSAPTPSAPAAPAHPARAASDEDYVSEDDEKVENSTFIGLRAIEKIIGGTVIDERPLHQP